MAKHTCHAIGCWMITRPEYLMCFRHWKMVPKDLQRAVWKHYRPGQCDDKKPSPEWIEAANAAAIAVHRKETEAAIAAVETVWNKELGNKV